MPDTMTMDRIADAQGAPVYDSDGDKIGAVEEIVYDVQTNPLRAEEAVAQKQVVAKERVAVDKDVETETETVTDEVRKERVAVEGDADER